MSIETADREGRAKFRTTEPFYRTGGQLSRLMRLNEYGFDFVCSFGFGLTPVEIGKCFSEATNAALHEQWH